jgi:hypothetical protein
MTANGLILDHTNSIVKLLNVFVSRAGTALHLQDVSPGFCAIIRFLQVTLDDIWSLDVVKLDGWKLIKDNTAGKEDFAENGAEESESEDSDAP